MGGSQPNFIYSIIEMVETASGFRLDRIRTLVSIATDSSQRVIMGGDLLASLVPIFLIGSSIFAGNKENHNISDYFFGFQLDPFSD